MVSGYATIQPCGPVVDVLKVFVSHKVATIIKMLNGVKSLANFNQKLNRHLASNPALEPIHAVTLATQQTTLGFATQGLQHMCARPDEDACFPDKNKAAENGYPAK